MFRLGVVVMTFGLTVGCGASIPSPTEPRSALPAPGALSVSADRATLLVGQSSQLRAFVTTIDGSIVDVSASADWKSSDAAVCRIGSTGIADALSAGRATITATWRSFSTSTALAVADSIRGRVTDYQTGSGVPGVVVQFADGSHDTGGTTDVNGTFLMSLRAIGPFTVSVDGQIAGTARVTGARYRGDLMIDNSRCVARYGTLADARTLKPVAGASVSLAGVTTTSGPDGWYRIDLGCPSTGTIGFNTTFLYVTHPDYAPRSQIMGRGIQRVARLDLDLEPK